MARTPGRLARVLVAGARTVAIVGASLRRWVSVATLTLVAAIAQAAPPSGPHPRFLIGGVKTSLAANPTRPEIAAQIAACDRHAGATIGAGYQGFDWAAQMSACAIAWHATGNTARAAQAVTYWKALLDDGDVVGDNQGGATGYGGRPIVSQDSGYSMRTYGLYSALGLDWLHDAPGVDAGLRAHAVSRLKVFNDWYAASGYLRDDPGNNYFTGYFLALWASAIAVGADDPAVGAALWDRADALTRSLVVPHMAGALKGGNWLESWQYGELATAAYLLAETAAVENGYAPFTGELASELVVFHLYALRPDGTFYDAGDYEDHPPSPGTASIWGALVARPSGQVADYARQYLAVVPKQTTVIGWAQAIAEAKAATWSTRDWTKDDLPLSYVASGSGTLLARSGWATTDTWTSFQVSARDGENAHQHADAGHFAFNRGADALAITSAAYGTWATWNHNTLLFDDQGRHSVYPPNQGAWGRADRVSLRHTTDVGVAVCAQGDFADAYLSNHDTNSVSLARRDFVYVRPNVLVISDRTAVDQGSVKTTFVLHTSVTPAVAGDRLTLDVGASQLTSQTLLPATPTRTTVAEPVANSGTGPWSNNDTYAPAFRAQESVTGATQTPFLHVLSATDKGTAAATATVTDVDGAHVVRVGDANVIVLSAAPDGGDLPLPLSYSVPHTPRTDHVVFGLPGAMFAVAVTEVGGMCEIVVSAGSDAHVVSADATAAFHLDGCSVGPPPAGSDGGITGSPDGGIGGGAAVAGGCGCSPSRAGNEGWSSLLGVVLVVVVLVMRRRRAASLLRPRRRVRGPVQTGRLPRGRPISSTCTSPPTSCFPLSSVRSPTQIRGGS